MGVAAKQKVTGQDSCHKRGNACMASGGEHPPTKYAIHAISEIHFCVQVNNDGSGWRGLPQLHRQRVWSPRVAGLPLRGQRLQLLLCQKANEPGR